jgi:hypothetical protein
MAADEQTRLKGLQESGTFRVSSASQAFKAFPD